MNKFQLKTINLPAAKSYSSQVLGPKNDISGQQGRGYARSARAMLPKLPERIQKRYAREVRERYRRGTGEVLERYWKGYGEVLERGSSDVLGGV